MSNVMKCQISRNVKCQEMTNFMKCQESWNVKCHEMSIVIKCQMSWNVKYHEMLMLMLDIWLQAETPGVTHFGAYNCSPDGHFLKSFTPSLRLTLHLSSPVFSVLCLIVVSQFHNFGTGIWPQGDTRTTCKFGNKRIERAPFQSLKKSYHPKVAPVL